MTLSSSALSLIALIALALSVLAVGFTIIGGDLGKRSTEEDPLAGIDDTLRGVLEGHEDKLLKLEQAVRALNGRDQQQQALIEGAVRHVALFRYDAFEDVGGRLSFSCALLDDHANGVVFTSINGRQDTRVYAKPVTKGTSTYNLSLEEQEVIRMALRAPAAAPAAAPAQEEDEATTTPSASR